jgi:GGDEF domain-containing protein
MLAHFLALPSSQLARLTIGTGTLASAGAVLSLRSFLRSDMRDRFVDYGSRFLAVTSASLFFAAFWPHPQQALIWSAIGVVLVALGSFWLTLRSWLLGDRGALGMTTACAFTVCAITGLYANALNALDSPFYLKVLTAVAAAAHIVMACRTLTQRHGKHMRMRKALVMNRDKDLLTRLITGAALIRRVEESVVRAKRNRKEMAILYVEIHNTAMLRKEFGRQGPEQVIYNMSARIKQVAGSRGNMVGRYSPSSFVIIINSLKTPSVLRSLGLRVAVAVRRPFVIDPMSSDQREFKADIGVGVARVTPSRHLIDARSSNSVQAGDFDSFSLVQDVLHDASELAMAARKLQSRAAIVDANSRQVVALELAKLQ